jgi:isopentenyldiphosphate isomerase
MSLSNLDIVKKVDCVPYPGEVGAVEIRDHCYSFQAHDGVRIGTILAFIVRHLKEFSDILDIDDQKKVVKMSPLLQTVEERSAGLAKIGQSLRDSGKFNCLRGWRNELYTIYNPSHTTYAHIERAVSGMFGLVTYGVHLVGYVPSPDGSKEKIKIWVPQRAFDKPTYPGMLDNTVAGGIGYPYGIEETVVKECYEEAGLEEAYVRSHIEPVGVATYYFRDSKSLDDEKGFFQPEVEYLYDLILDEGVTPRPVDGEVHQFHLWDVTEVKKQLSLGKFKYNTALITIDFFIRHGLITPTEEKDYTEIVQRCHRRLEFPLM